MNRYLLVFISLILFAGWAPAQQYWDIATYDGSPYANVSVRDLRGDTLVVSAMGREHELSIFRIASMKMETPSHTGSGLLLGALAGGAVSATLLTTSSTNAPVDAGISDLGNGLIIVGGVVAGGLLGGFIGSSHENTLSFPREMSPEKRRRRFERFLNNIRQTKP